MILDGQKSRTNYLRDVTIMTFSRGSKLRGLMPFGIAVWGVIGVVRPFLDAFTTECSKKENN